MYRPPGPTSSTAIGSHTASMDSRRRPRLVRLVRPNVISFSAEMIWRSFSACAALGDTVVETIRRRRCRRRRCRRRRLRRRRCRRRCRCRRRQLPRKI